MDKKLLFKQFVCYLVSQSFETYMMNKNTNCYYNMCTVIEKGKKPLKAKHSELYVYDM